MTHSQEQLHLKIDAIYDTLEKALIIARKEDKERETDVRYLLSLALQDLDYLKQES